MHAEQTRWARQYRAALRKHLRQGPKSSLRPAIALGRQAAALGMETLDVARIHEKALATLESSRRNLQRAELFFAEVNAPIEQTHRAAVDGNRTVQELTAALGRRTSGLAASRNQLKRRRAQRRSAEEALRKNAEHYSRLLAESRKLQEHLKHLTRRILSAQEEERKKVSYALQEEIAQTLLGINVRLSALLKGNAAHALDLKKEVASTQRLVEKSVKLMAHYTHELGRNHET
jgi:signal transduction histidine kinase